MHNAGHTRTYNWNIKPVWAQRNEAARQLGISEILAQILYNRSITDPDQARSFLNPKLNDLSEPQALPNILTAAERVAAACRDGQPIVIYGDYDVDGITGVAILWHCLHLLGANVDYYVPHRLEEGYGLNIAALEELAERGTKVVITVDCGIRAVEPAARARQLGIDLIITDHHELGPELPDAHSVVHPQLTGSTCTDPLCGAAVAFKLAWAIAREMSGGSRLSTKLRDFMCQATSLVALATVADVVPLHGENRVFTAFGLQMIADTTLTGLKALLEASDLAPNTRISSRHVGFVLGPRLNAAGRMGHAQLAIELLTRADEQRAREIAAYLNDQNRKRQSVERKIVEQVRAMIDALDELPNTIVLAHDDWHAGVIGIVASKLVDRYHRPTILIAIDNQTGTAQGSGRSIECFALNEALEACASHLTNYGGHEMAAGVRLSADNIGNFAAAFEDYASTRLDNIQLTKSLHIDAVAQLDHLDETFIAQTQKLQPFGQGNPPPILATDPVEVIGPCKTMGKAQNHLSFEVRQNTRVLRAVGFNLAPLKESIDRAGKCRVAFEPTLNEFRGRRSIELRVRDVWID